MEIYKFEAISHATAYLRVWLILRSECRIFWSGFHGSAGELASFQVAWGCVGIQETEAMEP